MTPGPNRVARRPTRVARRCARAGCARPATATLRFSPTRREARLLPVDPHAARTQGDLCDDHADALVLPRGWRLHDARAALPEPPAVQHDGRSDVVETDELLAAAHDSDLDRLLDARTPLLRRAFRNTRTA